MITRARSGSCESTLTPDCSQDLSQANEPARKKKKQARGRGPIAPRKADRWIFMMPEKEECASSDSIVSLKDPRTKCSQKYLFRKNTSECDHDELCEISKFSDEPRSWFIDNTIQTDGSLLVCTPVDPLFLALPYFQAAGESGKFTTLDVILGDSTHNESYRIISSCVPTEQWSNISQRKTVGSDTTVFRYSKEKTLAWLKKKIAALAEKLEQEEIYVGRGSRSSMFVESKKQSEITKDHFVNFSCGIVCDYLTEELAQEITKLCSVTIVNDNSDRGVKSEDNGGEIQTAKRIRLSGDATGPLEDYSGRGGTIAKDSAKLTVAQKTLAKIDKTGMKSLSSFFKKKPTSN